MPKFRYKAYDRAGQLTSGEIDAYSAQIALEKLNARGLLPFESAESSVGKSLGIFGKRGKGWHLSLEDWEEFTREISVFLQADIPLEQCVRFVADEARSNTVRKFSEDLHAKIIAGGSFSNVIQNSTRDAPPIIASVIRAAESSGRLSEALFDLAKYFAIKLELKHKITGALVYPIVLIITAFVVVAIVASTLVPALMPMFEQSNAEPPPILGFIAATTDWLKTNWQITAMALILMIVALRMILWTKAGMLARDRMILSLPIIGNLVRNSNIAIYSRTLGTLLNNGLSLSEALPLSADVMTNSVLRETATDAVNSVREGSSLSDALREKGGFNALALRFVSVGESASNLDVMLLHLAGVLESQTTRRLDSAVTLLGPILTIVIGVMVGGLILTVMQAVLGVNDLVLQ